MIATNTIILAGLALIVGAAAMLLWRSLVPARAGAAETPDTAQKSLLGVIVGEPLALARDQPHQILISTGSVALMGQFAGSSGVVHPAVGYCIAIGVEWAYLRGLASDSRSPTRWGGVLNWSAFLIVVLWGVLWVAQFSRIISAESGGWLLAAAHVVPIAWLSLCSAQCHRAAKIAEHRRAIRIEDEERRQAERQAEEERTYQRELQRRRDEMQLELEQRYRTMRLEEEARERRRASRTNSAAAQPSTAPGTGNEQDRRTLREHIARTLREQPEANRSDLARRLGIGRTLLYELISEAKAKGELS